MVCLSVCVCVCLSVCMSVCHAPLLHDCFQLQTTVVIRYRRHNELNMRLPVYPLPLFPLQSYTFQDNTFIKSQKLFILQHY